MKQFRSVLLLLLCASSAVFPANNIFQSIRESDYEEISQWLVSRPNNINVCNADGQSILICAVLKHDRRLAELFLMAGVDKTICDHFGKTAYDYQLEIEDQNRQQAKDAQFTILCAVGVVAVVVTTVYLYNKYAPKTEYIKKPESNNPRDRYNYHYHDHNYHGGSFLSGAGGHAGSGGARVHSKEFFNQSVPLSSFLR